MNGNGGVKGNEGLSGGEDKPLQAGYGRMT